VLANASVAVAVAGVICAGLVSLGERAPRAYATAAPMPAPVEQMDLGRAAEPVVLAEVVVAETTTSTTTTPPPPTTTTAVERQRSAPTEAPPAPPAREPDSVEAIIADVFGPQARAAVAVARCESSLRPGAISAGRGNWGLFQINRVHKDLVASLGYEWEDLLDARVNTLVAKVVYDDAGGWSPWDCAPAAR
jgi:hypothetical protein